MYGEGRDGLKVLPGLNLICCCVMNLMTDEEFLGAHSRNTGFTELCISVE